MNVKACLILIVGLINGCANQKPYVPSPYPIQNPTEKDIEYYANQAKEACGEKEKYPLLADSVTFRFSLEQVIKKLEVKSKTSVEAANSRFLITGYLGHIACRITAKVRPRSYIHLRILQEDINSVFDQIDRISNLGNVELSAKIDTLIIMRKTFRDSINKRIKHEFLKPETTARLVKRLILNQSIITRKSVERSFNIAAIMIGTAESEYSNHPVPGDVFYVIDQLRQNLSLYTLGRIDINTLHLLTVDSIFALGITIIKLA